MKLYELPRNMPFTLNGMEYILSHVDGMYSVCYNEYGEIAHIAAFTEVKVRDVKND